MTSVWKRLQRVGKKASKFQFAASYQELMVECTKKWQPDKLRVVWIRRNRRNGTKLHGWQPGIKNPYRGHVVWQVPESVDITVTLFKEPTAEEFEDKDWTFVIENETKGRRKVLASVDVNMKKYASATPAQYDLVLKMKPLSAKVVEATLKLTLTCIFLKEGKATDEDMQSLASLMSLKQSDIGNLDDFNDSDEDVSEDRKTSFGGGYIAAVTVTAPLITRIHDVAWRPVVDSGPRELQRQLSTLAEEECTTPTIMDPMNPFAATMTTSDSRRPGENPFEIEVVKPTAGSQVRRSAVEEVQTVEKPLDAPEPELVLGWEVLEAEGTVTEKEAKASLSERVEEPSGLVQAIVGVFHRGYETVTSILGPSSSSPAEVPHHPSALSSSVDPEEVEVSSEKSSLLVQDDTALAQKAEGSEEPKFDAMFQTKHSAELPVSAEPYMWKLADERSVSPSPTTDSDDGFLGVTGPSIMKKWPPLTEADITEISKEDLGGAEEERISLDSWHIEERSFPEQDLVQIAGSVEGLLAEGQPKTVQDEFNTPVSTSVLLDKCPQHTSTEEISASAVQPASDKSVVELQECRETIPDTPSEGVLTSPVLKTEVVVVPPQRGRKSKREVPSELKEKVSDQMKETTKVIPLRPLRRKDSVTPDRKSKPEEGSVTASLPTETPQTADVDATISTQPTNEAAPPRRARKRDVSLPLDGVVKTDVQETVTDQAPKQVVPSRPIRKKDSSLPAETEKAECIQKEASEAIQTPTDLVPPSHDLGDGILAPEAPQKTDGALLQTSEKPHRPLRRKDSLTGEKPVPASEEQIVQVGPAPATSDLVPHVSTTIESPRNIDDSRQEAVEQIPSRPVRRNDSLNRDRSRVTEGGTTHTTTDLVPPKRTRRTSCTPERPPKDNNVCVQAPTEVTPPVKTKEKGTISQEPKPEPFTDFGIGHTAPLSIIRKIAPPRSIKKVISRKSGKTEVETATVENLNAANKESAAPTQTDNILKDFADKGEEVMEHSLKVSEKVVEIAPSPKATEAAAKSEPLPIPMPRSRKRLSGSFADEDTPPEGTSPAQLDVPRARRASRAEETQTTGQRGRSPAGTPACPVAPTRSTRSSSLPPLPPADQPAASGEVVVPLRRRRSRLNIESKVKAEGGDTSEQGPGISGFPVPKPRAKKRLSGSFPDSVTPPTSPSPCPPETTTDGIEHKTEQQNDEASLPIPMPRPKKRLSATFPDSTPPADSLLPMEIESSDAKPQLPQEVTPPTGQEAGQGAASLESSMTSEAGFVTISGADDITTNLEKVCPAADDNMDLSQIGAVESNVSEKTLEDSIEGWTFTDKAMVTEDSSETISAVPDLTDAMASQAEADKTSACPDVSAQDDWMHIEGAKDTEPMEVSLSKEVVAEEMDFGFVSVEGAAEALEVER